ncbi:MAG: hypothetical protein PHF21_02370 [Bacilli bacterium]|nr:hypothetical protein [Bacilli bacterium]
MEKIKQLKKIIKSKRFIYLSFIFLLILFSLALNIGFSTFTNRSERSITNIKVAGMEYSLYINGKPNNIITAAKNEDTPANVTLISLNNVDSKYELTFKVCADSTCNNFVETPNGLKIEYSSKTIDDISGAIPKNGVKNLRIIATNETNTTYYIMLDINAGYIHNTLALKNLINTEYNEEDVIIATIIDGEISTTFPTTKGDYDTEVTCTTNNGASNATGSATWNGSKWVVNITGVDTGRTICNVEFYVQIINKILAQGGGITAIETKGNPDFDSSSSSSDTGIYAMEDEYDMSYYYRGEKNYLNNNLIWGGFQWKIVRINGDGSVRLIYNGTEAQFNDSSTMNDTGTNTQIKEAAWNLTNSNDAKYVGYMYGGANGVASTQRNGTTDVAATYNQRNSNAKTEIDNWFSDNISGKQFESNVVDNLFCNDRRLQNEVGGSSTGPGYGDGGSYFAAYYRLWTNSNPTLKCGLKNDKFTVSDTQRGNGALSFPVGLLTADEAAIAGLENYGENHTNYLYTNQTIWFFTPVARYYSLNTQTTFMFASGERTTDGSFFGKSGDLNFGVVTINLGLRPVLSIKGDLKVTGTGSATEPFIVN